MIHKIVMYGNMMKDEEGAYINPSIVFRITCRIIGTLYDTHDGCPAFVPNENGYNIQAELLLVSQTLLKKIDIQVRCPEIYHRETIQVMFEDGTTTKALIYVMNSLPIGAEPILGGD